MGCNRRRHHSGRQGRGRRRHRRVSPRSAARCSSVPARTRPAPITTKILRSTGKAYYTNNPPAGAFRGFGVTQTCYAMETTAAQRWHDEVGISPWEIRYRNAIRPGQALPNGQIVAAVHRPCGDARGGEGRFDEQKQASRRHRLRDEERGRRRRHSRYWGRCKRDRSRTTRSSISTPAHPASDRDSARCSCR